MNTPQPFWRKLFFAAALFNIGAAALLAFGHRDLVRLLGLGPAAEPPMYLNLLAFAIAMFGWGYYMISRDLTLLPLVRLGAWSKLGVVAIICGYWLTGTATWHLPLLSMGDVGFAAAFFTFLAQEQKKKRSARL